MKHSIKTCIAALAISAAATSYSQQDKSDSEGAVGWTPIAVGIASPVQLPWGAAAWDVFGLNLSLFYSDAPKMNGVDIAGLAAVTREDLQGVQVAGLFNGALSDVYGIRATLGLNMCTKAVYGAEFGFLGVRDRIVGFEMACIGTAQHSVCGLQFSGLANIVDGEASGCTLALGMNLARSASGLQGAIFFNFAEELHGAQIGLVNFADYCQNGFQIGLINIILSNRIKVLPIVNGYY